MQTLTLREIRAMDTLFRSDEEAGRVLMDSKLDEVLTARNARSLAPLARKLGFDLAKFCSYVWLQTYIKELSSTTKTLTAVQVVAKQFGIDPDEFDNYIQLVAIEYDDLVAEPPEEEVFAPWEREEALLEDLQNDAAMQGD